MQQVNIHFAKTHLSRLVEAIDSGTEHEIVIARAGKPAARLVPVAPPQQLRRGLAKGHWNLSDFDADDKMIEAMFEGRPST